MVFVSKWFIKEMIERGLRKRSANRMLNDTLAFPENNP